MTHQTNVQSITEFTVTHTKRVRNYSFDTILMLGTNFGLFESFTRASWLLRRLHKMTADTRKLMSKLTRGAIV
jgi:hypothetical protein